MDVSIIIPAHNEEGGIGKTLDKIKEVLSQSTFNYELIVVNDGSTDRTAEIAKDKGVKLINHDFNHGYGASIKAGVRQSKYSIILITDADGTYPPDAIPAILKDMANYDMVVGARVGRHVRIPLIRRPAKWILKNLANYLSESKIIDLNSGLRAIRKDAFYKFMRLLPDGFSLTTTITLAMLTGGLGVKYIPIDYRARIGKSKIRPIHDTLNFIQLIIRTSILFNPLKLFLPIGLAMIIASFLVFFYSLCFLPRILDITTLLFFVSGIQIIAIGLLADLINRRLP